MGRLKYDDKIFLSCCIFAMMLACITFLWNFYHQNYYLDFQWIGGIQGVYIVTFFCMAYFLSVFVRIPYPTVVRVWKSVAMLYISLSILEICNTAILTTPFPTHDQWMVHTDRLLGFHLLPILRVLHGYASIQSIIWSCYFSLLAAIHFLPISLSFDQNPKVMYHYYCSFIVSIIIGYLIYYFFPTMTSPAAVYPHQYFTAFQLNTLHQFQLEHLHKIIHFNLIGGIISFPSFHAIWAVFVIYFLWPYGWIRYVGIIYGILIFATSVLTGWHYLVDVFSGIGVALLSLWISRYFLYARSSKTLITEQRTKYITKSFDYPTSI